MQSFRTLIQALVTTAIAAFASVSFAAVDANQASQAELEAVKSIGPTLAGRMLEERKKAPFKDWNDMVERVKGVGAGNAAKLSAQGLTVNGTEFNGTTAPAAAAKPKRNDDKPAPAKKA